MNKELANFYFPSTPDDDLFDLWEDRFFETKQFFLTKTPLRAVWESRLKRVIKMHEAYMCLIDEEISTDEKEFVAKDYVFSSDFIEAFNQFHELRNLFKGKVLQAKTLEDLVSSVQDWLHAELCYAKHWSYPASAENELSAIRGKEPDPMYFLNDLKLIKDGLGYTTVEEIHKNYDILPEDVKKEVKRLTLLAQK